MLKLRVFQAGISSSWLAAALCGVLVGACTAERGDPGGKDATTGGASTGITPPVGQTECATVTPGPSLLRRLGGAEYERTVRDLFSGVELGMLTIPVESKTSRFSNDATSLSFSDVIIEGYLLASEQVAERALSALDRLLPCDPGQLGERACAELFIERFGERAWRRPLDMDERNRLTSLFAEGAVDSFSEGIKLVVQALLQSPRFLYRVEQPVAAQGAGPRRLDSWDVASRLAFFLWSSMPDAELFAAAREAKLQSPEEVSREAARMLENPRARQMVSSFYADWLGLGLLERLSKDQALFPEFNPDLRQHFREETQLFIDEVVWNQDANVRTLLTAPFTFVSGPLSIFYGLGEVSGSTPQRVSLVGSPRAGLLTQASFLALNSKSNQTSPIHRGAFIREQLLCDELPSPPEGLVVEPPALDPNLTTRERFALHSGKPECAGCHTLMDPIGLGFERFDAVGRYRDHENGQPIAATGVIHGTDIEGPFDGASELIVRLAESRQVQSCVVTQWYRRAFGRHEVEADRCAIRALDERFAQAEFDVRKLLLEIVKSPSFLNVAGDPP